MEQSILETTKTMLGIAGQTDFDLEIITNINAAFLELKQIGAGKDDVNLYIDSKDVNWTDLFEDGESLNAIINFVHLSVKLIFDPPQTSFGISAIEKLLAKYTWRINTQVDGGD